MKEKNVYEELRLQLLSMNKQDVITTSTSGDWQDAYDDKGTWNPDWFTGN